MMKSIKLKRNCKNFKRFLSFENLDIQQYNVDNSICENINDPLIKAIVRYRNHPSIAGIKNFCNFKPHFSFKNVQGRNS